jgi:hypothetical protein
MSDRKFFIFICYRGADQHWATEHIYARLTAAFGADAVFKAGNSIRIGETFPPILREQAASCPIMLVCIGPGWLTAGDPERGRDLDRPDDWVRQEITIALQTGNHVIPLLIGNRDEVDIPPADQLPDEIKALSSHQAWRLVAGSGLDLTMPKLISRLAELAPELGAPDGHEAGARPDRDEAGARPDQDEAAGPGVRHEQTNIARDHGAVFAVQGGDFHYHPPGPPGPPGSAAGGTDGTTQPGTTRP